MRTLPEIEEAIECLPAHKVEELTAWLHRRREGGGAGSIERALASGEAKPSVRSFFGRFSSGDSRGADNERIDADLAAEAAGRSRE